MLSEKVFMFMLILRVVPVPDVVIQRVRNVALNDKKQKTN